jgi:nicotinate-nucleotide adenylyltransferase
MKIGILGGSFDPPHMGHYWITRQILEYRPDIDKILLVPAYKHQWKEIVASPEDRLAMLKTLIGEKIEISTVELDRKGISYTIDTLKQVREETNAELYWIVGSDILSELDKWDKAEGLMQYANFLVFPRDPYLLPDALPKGFEAIRSPSLITSNISSTAIRRRIAENLPLTNFVPADIEAYIKTHTLYR